MDNDGILQEESDDIDNLEGDKNTMVMMAAMMMLMTRVMIGRRCQEMREICPGRSSELPICGRRAREQYGRSASQLVDYPINGGQLSSTALWELWWLRTIPIEAGALLSSPECFSRSH